MNASLIMASRSKRRSPFVTYIALSALAGVAMLAGVLTAVVLFSANQANALAAEHQQALLTTVLEQSAARIAHDQEGPTIWDESVRKVRSPQLDGQWLDANLGAWMHSYHGHDATFIVDDRNRAIYAMRDGRRVSPEAFGHDLSPAAIQLVADLRRKLRNPSPAEMNASVRSPGVIDLAMVGGHPSIVSVKPIVSDNGSPRQIPGSEFLHISVRRLDGNFASSLASQYALDDAHVSDRPGTDGDLASVPLTSKAGKTLGYFVWRPFTPGAMMIRRIAPVAVIAVLMILGMVLWLLQWIRRSALQLQASEAQSQHLAFHDALTGLANRALFDDRLSRALADAHGKTSSVALLHFDIDRFKTVNDTLGHPAGDELIYAMGRRLVEATRSTDIVARIGGDEFAIIQRGVTSAAEVEILCMRTVEALSEPFDLAGAKISIGVSIGIAIAPADANDRTELARKAGIALYEAKAAGSGRYVFFAEAMDASIRHRRRIEQDLRAALAAGDQFEVLYQPLYAAQSGIITGAEALVRWHHPLLGTMMPATFIPIAEATGLIVPLGEWVLERACATAVGWPINSVSVNVSAVQLRDDRFADMVLAILARTGLDPAHLELEITETSFIESAAKCQLQLATLRARGVQIALDDFGTGYSSFTHLRHFDIDRIKIDQSFVSGIDMRDGGSAIIQAIVDLAKASGMQVTAEGVETREQSAFLTEVGCNALQGYLLSWPLAVDQLDALFESSGTTAAGGTVRGDRRALTAARTKMN